MHVDTIAEKVESLTEKINSLNYPFVDIDLQAESTEALTKAVEALETYLDLVTRDGDENPREDEESD
jgi:hypothetical protein